MDYIDKIKVVSLLYFGFHFLIWLSVTLPKWNEKYSVYGISGNLCAVIFISSVFALTAFFIGWTFSLI